MLCWGYWSLGQPGISTNLRGIVAEPQVCGFISDRSVKEVACGGNHSVFLLEDGEVYTCGLNTKGQLGHEREGNKPEQIGALADQNIVHVACGESHSLALSDRGQLFSWGAGSDGQLGLMTTEDSVAVPRLIQKLNQQTILQVSCGNWHCLALAADGQFFTWGKNSHGQLGLGKEFPSQASPQRVRSLEGIPLAQVAAGGAHSFALSLSGTSFGWGSNNTGQLALSGNNTPVQRYKPHSIGALKSLDVIYISCGYEHTAVLTQNGKVFTFGDNSCGQLGYNPTAKKRGPQQVEGIDGLVSQIDCGSYHTLAYVYTTGEVVSFGRGRNCASSPTHSEAQMENFDMSCLISANDLVDVQVKHIFAGTYVNVVTTYQETSSTNVSKKTLPEISRINQPLMEQWMAVTNGNTQHELAKSEIRVIFSSPACLTASFLKKRESGKTNSIDVDLQVARDTFEKLTKKKWISLMITTYLKDNLLRALPYRSLHQEALSIFLLLPQCPVMHDSGNWKMVVLFAEAVCKMSDQSLGVLKKCWASLQESSLSALVQMLKTAVIAQLNYWNITEWDNRNVIALLRTMKEVHKANKTNSQLPENAFNINELSNWLNFHGKRKLVLFKDNNMITEEKYIFSEFPFIFNLLSKIKLWQADSYLKMQGRKMNGQMILPKENEFPPLPIFTLRVRRSHLTEDALRQLSQAEVTDLQKPLVIEFIKEIRSEGVGVKSEFFHCIFEEMTKTEYGMFIYPEEGSYMWIPVSPKFEKKRYFLFGMLCGLSLYNSNVANLPFPLALFKKLLGQQPSLEDLKELSPLLGRNLQEVLNDEADDIGEELYIHFSLHWDHNDVDLIPNGSSILVDQTNKKDYVSKCVDYIFNTSVKAIYEEFQRGFYKICDKEVLRFFKPEELMTVIVGNTDYDWEQFEKNSNYDQGYHKSHPTILMFWKAFHKLTLDEKRKFLFFLTGNDRQTVKGLREIKITFRCPETFSERDCPRSLVCHGILDLPKYSTMERMEEALQIAINSSRGFVSPMVTE